MMSKGKQIIELAGAVRAVFNRLKALADDLHSDLEITTAMRAVMETLSAAGPMTVPQIAREKGVTRQHIQLLTDALLKAGHAVGRENPAHRRSPLIALTEKGKRVFGKMSEREVPIIEEIAAEFGQKELERATQLLNRLSARLDERLHPEEERD